MPYRSFFGFSSGRLVANLTGMPYLLCLPGLLCGLVAAVSDVRRRRVPRVVVAVGCVAQLAANLVWGAVANDFFVVLQALLFAALCALVQLALALAKPGALGLGDVTATLMLGLAVGTGGLMAVVLWWLLMGLAGLAFVTLWLRFDPQRRTPYAGKAPFAPVIVAAAAAALALAPLL